MRGVARGVAATPWESAHGGRTSAPFPLDGGGGRAALAPHPLHPVSEVPESPEGARDVPGGG